MILGPMLRQMAASRVSLLTTFLLVILLRRPTDVLSQVTPRSCSATEEQDPALKEMRFDIGKGEEIFLAYVQPDITSFYKDNPPASQPTVPKHQGIAVKFLNMSNKPLRLYWDGGPGLAKSLIAQAGPFESVGTASFPGHKFYFTPEKDPENVLIGFSVDPPKSNYFYDPYEVESDPKATEKNLKSLSQRDLQHYMTHKRNRLFNQKYFEFTGREYLSMYPRARPSHFMWRADHLGQQHWAITKETHFKELPNDRDLLKITEQGAKRVLSDEEPRLLQEYRTGEPFLNMTMTVISCAPRAFEINNFLTEVEINHVMKLATGMDLSKSLTNGGQGADDPEYDDRGTRTSFNTWVDRETDPVVDAIYRRAADLFRIDEALLRPRDKSEHSGLGSQSSIAEALQLVHYAPGQEYTAHHDFGYARIDRPQQEARFLTLLLYLNEGMIGGETEFPRWVNAETFKGLEVTPEKGKAVLFYSQLPDGNMDDLSHHAALPINVGEKWLMNLWVWDPTFH